MNSYHLHTTRKETAILLQCINTCVLLTIRVRSRWLDIGQVLFLYFFLQEQSRQSQEDKTDLFISSRVTGSRELVIGTGTSDNCWFLQEIIHCAHRSRTMVVPVPSLRVASRHSVGVTVHQGPGERFTTTN